jgi:hypothetical protein
MAHPDENAWLKASQSFYSATADSPAHSLGPPSQTFFSATSTPCKVEATKSKGLENSSSLSAASKAQHSAPEKPGDSFNSDTSAKTEPINYDTPKPSTDEIVKHHHTNKPKTELAEKMAPVIASIENQLGIVHERLNRLETSLHEKLAIAVSISEARIDSHRRYLEQEVVNRHVRSVGEFFLAKYVATPSLPWNITPNIAAGSRMMLLDATTLRSIGSRLITPCR